MGRIKHRFPRRVLIPAAIGTWATVEETSSCASTANRTFNFTTANATYTANDTVAAWAGVGSC